MYLQPSLKPDAHLFRAGQPTVRQLKGEHEGEVENVLDRHLDRLVLHVPDSMRYSLF